MVVVGIPAYPKGCIVGPSKALLVVPGCPVTVEDAVLGRDEGGQPKRRNPKEHLTENKRNPKCPGPAWTTVPSGPRFMAFVPWFLGLLLQAGQALQLASQEALPRLLPL